LQNPGLLSSSLSYLISTHSKDQLGDRLERWGQGQVWELRGGRGSAPRLCPGEPFITPHMVTDPGHFEKMYLVNYLPIL